MNILKSLFSIFTFALFAWPTLGFTKPQPYPVDVLPDAPSSRYEMLLQDQNNSAMNHQSPIWGDALPQSERESPYVEKMIQAGTRNMNWLKFINSHRDDPIALTKPGELKAYPIESPSIYSPKTIEKSYNDLVVQVPENIRKIVFEGATFTNDPGLPLEDYITWAKKIDRAYQTASRWKLISPSLFWYAMNASNDLRGYYFLNKKENQVKLQNFSQLNPEDQKQFSTWLTQICTNTERNSNTCKNKVAQAIQSNQAFALFQHYNPGAQNLWDEYFDLSSIRHDFTWTYNNENLTTVPFRSTTPKVMDYLKTNIEDEWKWNNWQLQINFTPNADIHVEFVPETTPHVNGLAGNTITMDDNAPLTEWDVQWTIRHEFGHVVGFQDCYIEFYDSDNEEMVNYQLDIENLMCSRKGKFQKLHYDEMRKKYLH